MLSAPGTYAVTLRGSDTLPASAPALFEAVQREYGKVTGALVQLTA